MGEGRPVSRGLGEARTRNGRILPSFSLCRLIVSTTVLLGEKGRAQVHALHDTSARPYVSAARIESVFDWPGELFLARFQPIGAS